MKKSRNLLENIDLKPTLSFPEIFSSNSLCRAVSLASDSFLSEFGFEKDRTLVIMLILEGEDDLIDHKILIDNLKQKFISFISLKHQLF